MNPSSERENLESFAERELRQLEATPHTRDVLVAVADERRRQEVKWGEQNHDPFLYLTILGEEYGESCEAALRYRFPGPSDESGELSAQAHLDLMKELIQVAAVAVAAVECLNRDKWLWGGHAVRPEVVA